MGQKSRPDLTALVDQKIYDNTQKEILASMVRDVLKDFKDSHFNWISDELKTAMYNSTQTLEQYLNAIAGAVPIYGRVLNGDVGESSGDLSVDGAIASASFTAGGAGRHDSLIRIVFSQSFGNKRLIPVITIAGNVYNWNDQNDICTPVIRRVSTKIIELSLREVASHTQNLDIEIIVI